MVANTAAVPSESLSVTPEAPPRVAGALASWPAAPNWMAGAVLFACLWMPQVTGCDGSVVRPIHIAHEAIADRSPHALFPVWPYLFGLFTSITLVASMCLFRERADRVLARCAIGLWFGIWTGFFLFSVLASGSGDWETIAGGLPILILYTVWWTAALRRRDYLTVWARITTGVAMLAWIWTRMLFLFAQQAHYGLVVADLSLLTLAIAPWLLRLRWRRLIVDSRAATQPIRFQVMHLLVAMSVFAFLYGYYSFLPKVID